ncbi:Putative serine protease 47, partial [Fukomys damarensis]
SQALMDYQVLLGNTELYQQTQHTQKIFVSKIIIHPDFEKFHPFGSDIAMLQLHLPVNVSPYVIPVCLPAPDMQLPSHTSCWITGWGMLTEDSEFGMGEAGGGGREQAREVEEDKRPWKKEGWVTQSGWRPGCFLKPLDIGLLCLISMACRMKTEQGQGPTCSESMSFHSC